MQRREEEEGRGGMIRSSIWEKKEEGACRVEGERKF